MNMLGNPPEITGKCTEEIVNSQTRHQHWTLYRGWNGHCSENN